MKAHNDLETVETLLQYFFFFAKMMKYLGNTFLKVYEMLNTYHLKFKIKLLVPILNLFE